jgi:hypothetical protein
MPLAGLKEYLFSTLLTIDIPIVPSSRAWSMSLEHLSDINYNLVPQQGPEVYSISYEPLAYQVQLLCHL